MEGERCARVFPAAAVVEKHQFGRGSSQFPFTAFDEQLSKFDRKSKKHPSEENLFFLLLVQG